MKFSIKNLFFFIFIIINTSNQHQCINPSLLVFYNFFFSKKFLLVLEVISKVYSWLPSNQQIVRSVIFNRFDSGLAFYYYMVLFRHKNGISFLAENFDQIIQTKYGIINQLKRSSYIIHNSHCKTPINFSLKGYTDKLFNNKFVILQYLLSYKKYYFFCLKILIYFLMYYIHQNNYVINNFSNNNINNQLYNIFIKPFNPQLSRDQIDSFVHFQSLLNMANPSDIQNPVMFLLSRLYLPIDKESVKNLFSFLLDITGFVGYLINKFIKHKVKSFESPLSQFHLLPLLINSFSNTDDHGAAYMKANFPNMKYVTNDYIYNIEKQSGSILFQSLDDRKNNKINKIEEQLKKIREDLNVMLKKKFLSFKQSHIESFSLKFLVCNSKTNEKKIINFLYKIEKAIHKYNADFSLFLPVVCFIVGEIGSGKSLYLKIFHRFCHNCFKQNKITYKKAMFLGRVPVLSSRLKPEEINSVLQESFCEVLNPESKVYFVMAENVEQLLPNRNNDIKISKYININNFLTKINVGEDNAEKNANLIFLGTTEYLKNLDPAVIRRSNIININLDNKNKAKRVLMLLSILNQMEDNQYRKFIKGNNIKKNIALLMKLSHNYEAFQSNFIIERMMIFHILLKENLELLKKEIIIDYEKSTMNILSQYENPYENNISEQHNEILEDLYNDCGGNEIIQKKIFIDQQDSFNENFIEYIYEYAVS